MRPAQRETCALEAESLPSAAPARDAVGHGSGIAPRIQTPGFVLCELADALLAIPRDDVQAIEHGRELVPPLAHERVLGWFEGASGARPVYALDGALRPGRSAARTPALVVFLSHASSPIGLACERARVLSGRERFEVAAVPSPFLESEAARAVTGLARLDAERLALVCASGALATYLTAMPAHGA